MIDSHPGPYSANALMSLGNAAAAGPGGSRTTHGSLDDSIVSSDLGNPVSVGLNGVNGGGPSNPGVATTSPGMQWPLLLFSDGMGVGGP